MDLMSFFLFEVMLQRVDKMEQIGEHEDPTTGSLSGSLYVRHVGFLVFRVAVPVVGLKFNEKRSKWALKGGSDIALPTQGVENRSEEKKNHHHD